MARLRSRSRVSAFFGVLVPLGTAGARGQAQKPAVVTFSLEATAKDAPSAVSLAKLALERFDR